MTYDIKCNDCEIESEIFLHRFTDKSVCPNCGSSNVKRLISGRRKIVFKGSGFYETDYKAKSHT